MELILKNKNGSIFNIEALNGRPEPISFNVDRETLKRFANYGSVRKGDGFISDRRMYLKFDISGERDVDYDDVINTIASFFDIEDEPIYLENLDSKRRCKISLNGIEETYQEGLAKRVAIGCRLNLNIDSVLWEDTDETVKTATLNNNDSMNIILPNNAKPTYPIFELENLDPGPNGPFALILTNGDFSTSILINDTSFTQTKVCTINNITGEVYVQNVLANTKIDDGNFFFLRKGTNVLTYQTISGNSVALTARYRIAKAW